MNKRQARKILNAGCKGIRFRAKLAAVRRMYSGTAAQVVQSIARRAAHASCILRDNVARNILVHGNPSLRAAYWQAHDHERALMASVPHA